MPSEPPRPSRPPRVRSGPRRRPATEQADGPPRLEIVLVRQRGDWRFLSRLGPFGRYDFQVDALAALPAVLAKLRRRGWLGPVDLFVQQPWGELVGPARP